MVNGYTVNYEGLKEMAHDFMFITRFSNECEILTFTSLTFHKKAVPL